MTQRDMAQVAAILGWHFALGLTYRRYRAVEDYFAGDWVRAWGASGLELRLTKLTNRDIDRLDARRSQTNPERIAEQVAAVGATVVLHDDEVYPAPLREIAQPPAILLVRGEFSPEDWPAIAVVGTRKMSSYGKRVVERLIPPLARRGVTVVSGLALGVDLAAHQAATQAGGRTIAVMGCGIDQVYPLRHEKYAQEILASGQGVIVSEYLPGVVPDPKNFPVRNRIVAGMTQGVLVVEAARRSGSLITARLANESNREVFAVPGEIFSEVSEGTHDLLRAGATPVTDVEDIYAGLGWGEVPAGDGESAPTVERPAPETLEGQVLALWAHDRKCHIDELVRRAAGKLPQPVVTSHLMILEVRGVVSHEGGQVYVRHC